MCSPACIDFGRKHLTRCAVNGRTILEVGSRDVNGSLRPFVEAWTPRSYVGVDITPGAGVDVLCDICEVSARFGRDVFDVVLCTEVLEHVRDWRGAPRELTAVLRPNGILLITTRSLGFPIHGYPHDFWRYELADMPQILSGMNIESLESDPYAPGVFLKARKLDAPATGLDEYELYSVVRRRRSRDVTDFDILRFTVQRRLWRLLPRSLRPAWARPQPDCRERSCGAA